VMLLHWLPCCAPIIRHDFLPCPWIRCCHRRTTSASGRCARLCYRSVHLRRSPPRCYTRRCLCKSSFNSLTKCLRIIRVHAVACHSRVDSIQRRLLLTIQHIKLLLDCASHRYSTVHVLRTRLIVLSLPVKLVCTSLGFTRLRAFMLQFGF